MLHGRPPSFALSAFAALRLRRDKSARQGE
jgi:hypothetical protein